MQIQEAIKHLRENSKKRGFPQTVDLIINLKNINLKDPANKINKEFVLPHGRGKDVSVCVIGEKEEINKDMLGELAKDKKRAKKIIDSYDFFLCEAPLMPIVGKTIGRFLGPRGKMPKPIPPNADKTKFVELAKKSVRIRVKDSPVIHTVVGTENMSDDELKDNIEFLVRKIQETLPKGRAQIKDILLKLTMSKPIKIEVK
ncbi:MAG: 50S ribosomal protein L1 [Candidatus Aenigmarchaeota archaeon ex4484_14]|nr:MAG: 50S ribosomal protein L1 [Candidatus Aenigmarchaeota archaeon ex4484_14]